MVLFYGLLALETANNTVATTGYQRRSKRKAIEKMSSSSNSWIYTQDLKKRFEERYVDLRYIVIPVYIDRNKSNTTEILPTKSHHDNSWMYSRSFRNYLYYSTTNISSSTCCVTNHGFMRDDLPNKTNSKRITSTKDQSISSLSSFNPTTNVINHRTNDLVEEDDEIGENENYSKPLIKHNSVISSSTTNGNNTTIKHHLGDIKSNPKHAIGHNNRLTRLRSFFFKSSSSSLPGIQQ